MPSTGVVHRRNALGVGWKKQEGKSTHQYVSFECHSFGLGVVDHDLSAAQNMERLCLEQVFAKTSHATTTPGKQVSARGSKARELILE